MDVLITENKKRVAILLVIILIMIMITGCGEKGSGDNNDKGSKDSLGSTEEYLKIANEVNTLLATVNDYEQLKFDLDSMRNNMTDKVYDNNFNLSVPYLASMILVENYEKLSYEILETVINQTKDGEGKSITNIYMIYNMQLRSAEVTGESDDHVFDMGKVTKYVFSNGKLVDFQIIM